MGVRGGGIGNLGERALRRKQLRSPLDGMAQTDTMKPFTEWEECHETCHRLRCFPVGNFMLAV